ncbi:MAG: hypothetical protein PHH47_12565 [Gallionella sp.]|nr:hypothetical protein [Gallionella sp.]MDD4946292.1 hypothetical protein [Gallionella sp.]MDD5612261.1 hypothetical protein [Gallionella sp.]
MRRYLAFLLLSSVVSALCLAAFNWKVDPYAIFQTQGVLDQRQPLSLLTMNERVFKTVRLAREHPEAIVLGTSRADIGMNLEHPGFTGMRAANLATFGQPIIESHRLLTLAASNGGLKTALVGLDFFAFNALFPYPSDFDAANFAASRPLQLAFSVSTSMDGWKYRKRKAGEPGDCCYSNGVRYPNLVNTFTGHYRSHFQSSERMYLLEKYRPSPTCDYAFSGRKQASTLEDLRAMIALAHRQNIALKLFISPSHARQWQVIEAAGLTGKWEAWKRELVKINSEEAAHVSRSPFPLWDFSGYDAVSSEAVPQDGDQQTSMRWYSDSSHYTPALGRVIQDKLFGLPVSEPAIPEDFGVELTPATLEAKLAAIRAGALAYRASHPADMAEIDQMAAEAAHRKYCIAKVE